jgi:hypothetical protein
MRPFLATAACLIVLLASGCSSGPSGVPPGGSPQMFGYGAAAASSTAGRNIGRIQIGQWPNLTIDNKPMRAAPGARIIGPGNRMITANLVPPGARVQYELDGMGQVRSIRLLTE